MAFTAGAYSVTGTHAAPHTSKQRLARRAGGNPSDVNYCVVTKAIDPPRQDAV